MDAARENAPDADQITDKRANAGAHVSSTRTTSKEEGRRRQSTDSEADTTNPYAVPPSVAERFLRIDNKYFFPDRTLAFVDRGKQLKARTHNREVVRNLIVIAQARGWESIKVTGTEEFRREVWREAASRGVEVSGYLPSEFDLAEMQRTRSAGRSRSSLEAAPATSEGQAPQQGAAGRRTGDASPERITGQLVEHGAAPYRFDPKGSLSYFVRLRTDQGDRTVWGTDLERAVVESRSRVALDDIVSLERRGSVPVTVKTPKRDEDGSLVGSEVVQKRRNTWLVERPSWFEERERSADALRQTDVAKTEIARQHPEIADALLGLWLGEQFASRLARADNGERFASAVRDRIIEAVRGGDEIRVPPLNRRSDRSLEPGDDRPLGRSRSRSRSLNAEEAREGVAEESLQRG